MKFGFIGAGKVGFSLGKYFAIHDLDVVGYYSEVKEDSLEAADFTNSKSYDSLQELVEDSDVLFLTVPDDSLEDVWNQLNSCHFTDKIICHTSGVHTSEIFSGLDNHEAHGYSIHPLCAINDKYKSYEDLSQIYFTIEGDEEKLDEVSDLFVRLGNKVNLIKTEDKARYHLAAAVAKWYLALSSVLMRIRLDTIWQRQLPATWWSVLLIWRRELFPTRLWFR